jgi:hypothetical protein
VPVPNTAPTIPDKDRYGAVKTLWEQGQWTAACFLEDGSWTWASETPPCPPSFFESRQEAEAKLSKVQRRAEVYSAATHSALSPHLMAARVSEATTLEVKRDFEAEVASNAAPRSSKNSARWRPGQPRSARQRRRSLPRFALAQGPSLSA